jgi:2',3'-cyclic-nucleotide 2'-phosphodiesterase (5'-nucleotidase family)
MVLAGAVWAQKVKATFLQINDLYEIAPIQGGKFGGPARVATLRRQLLLKNPQTVTVIAGDFFSPSVFNLLEYNGQKVRGAQMVDVLNALPIDYATFGNHEFDIPYEDFQKRMNESRFTWISSNTKNVNSKGVIEPFYAGNIPVAEYKILKFQDSKGHVFRVGLIGVTLPYNKAGYVTYEDVIASAKRVIGSIKDSCEAVVALTHQSIEEDQAFAQALPEVKLIMGGHEHAAYFQKTASATIAKADANVRSVYVHHLKYDTRKKKLKIKSSLLPVTDKIKSDPQTESIVNKWMNLAYESYRKLGFEPTEVVYTTAEPLEGTEYVIRSQQTNLGQLICQAMLAASDRADIVLLNSGSIRVDDRLMEKITQYDILRTLPFGGAIGQVDIKGDRLRQLLDAGIKNKGTGAYLQMLNVRYDEPRKAWLIKEEPLADYRTYRVVMTEYMLAGRERDMGFLKDNPDIKPVTDNPDPQKAELRADIRKVVLSYLKNRK